MIDQLNAQRAFFASGATRGPAFRKRMLQKLQQAITRNERLFYWALHEDLGKSETEAYLTEIQIVQTEIQTALRHLNHWVRPKRVPTPVSHFPGKSRVYAEPYGSVLILSPWNYPLQLALAPLVGALAAGNCAVLKPSASSPNVSSLLRKMLAETFEEQVVFCVPEETSYADILSQRYDFIFFTGSARVGREVMAAAARHLTPLVLELGGKSPCIVDRHADLDLAAKRIAWGKLLNAGQTCVAPDYVLADEAIHDALVHKLERYCRYFYPNALENASYPHIVNRRHFDRLCAYLDQTPDKLGGAVCAERLKIEPTLFPHACWDDPVMQEEIFGPILPVLTYQTIDDALAEIQARAKPLALYVFSRDKRFVKQVLSRVSFGGGCVNDTVMHLANNHLPFGGVGESGMGRYHGAYSFAAFSHQKGVFHSGGWPDVPLRYPPFTEHGLKKIKRLLNCK